jgi:hypothetical protein
VRELTRVAVPDTEGAWLAAAQGKTIRQLEDLVATKSPGDAPEALTTQPSALARAALRGGARDIRAVPRRHARATTLDGRLHDDAVLLMMARHLLAGPGDEGRAPYQVSLTVCARCARGEQLGGGESVPIGAEVVTMAGGDGQHIGPLPQRAANENGATDSTSTAQRTTPTWARRGLQTTAPAQP